MMMSSTTSVIVQLCCCSVLLPWIIRLQLRDHDVYTLSNKNSPFSEIDVEMMNGNPAVPGSIWLNSFFKVSRQEASQRPHERIKGRAMADEADS
jgi:hypothetical protein